MFTGLIEAVCEIQTLTHVDGALQITLPRIFPAKIGDSIAVNGACLTVESCNDSRMTFFLSKETLGKTALGSCKERELVNLERSLTLSDRLDGHLVSGHVDTRALVTTAEKKDGGMDLVLNVPPEYDLLMIPKGSLCVNGVSLTINAIQYSSGLVLIHLFLIPTTLAKTNLGLLKKAALVNLEFDLVGKYILKQTNPSQRLKHV
jgi:riboflavin synthase